MSRLEGGETGHGADASSAGGYFLPSAVYGEGTELGGRSPVGLATVNAFLEATAKVSTASATTAATACEASADDEAAAIRAIRESMLALAVSRGDSGSADPDASVDETSLPKSTSFRSGDAGDSGVRLAESRVEPGAPVVFRTREAREASPERLDLDRMGLRECCLLEGEHRLRLLNYQGNRIARVSRLESVKNLVFLDLTENALESLEGVEACPHLRVLLVAKNRLRRLGRALASLPKLDVLDARENGVDAVGDAAAVFGAAAASLRVLNLAGNALRTTGDLRALRGLQELDLRRNAIETLGSRQDKHDSALPRSLRRCFLSGNPLASRDALAPLASLNALEALALDGTPWQTNQMSQVNPFPGGSPTSDAGDGFSVSAASGDATARYRAAAVSVAPRIRTLDGTDVDEEERRAARGFFRLDRDDRDGARPPAMSSAASKRDDGSASAPSSSSTRDDATKKPSDRGPPGDGDASADAADAAASASTSRSKRVPTPPDAARAKKPPATRGVPRAGDSRRFETPLGVAFDAATRTLTVRGRVETEATLRDHPGASLARRVVFAEGVFSGAAAKKRAASPAVGASAGDRPEQFVTKARDATFLRAEDTRLLRWARGASPRATALEFQDRGMGTLELVDAVARAGWRAESDPARRSAGPGPKQKRSGLESLRVAAARGATFTSRGPRSAFFRPYAIHRLPTLQFVDDIAVTPETRARAAAAFAGQEDATGGARREDARDESRASAAASAAADGTPAYVDGVVARASEMAEKLRALDACWDGIVRAYVAEGLGFEG